MYYFIGKREYDIVYYFDLIPIKKAKEEEKESESLILIIIVYPLNGEITMME